MSSLKTKQAFLQNPLHDNHLDLLYKTGDIVAYNEKGELLCYGRADNQIKYMGHRIELGEIESVINSHEKIKNSDCHVRGFVKRLVWFFLCHCNTLKIKKFHAQKAHLFRPPL